MPLTVVLADDNEDHRAAVRLLLELAPGPVSVVGEAADGHEALEMVRRERPDLLIADVVMPHLDGLELVALVKRERPGIKVILMTAYGYRPVSWRSGADAYVNKYQISTGLLPTIRDLVTGGHPGGSSTA